MQRGQAAGLDAVALTDAASDAELDANREEVDGVQRRNQIRRSLLEVIGQQDTAAAASGLDLSFGTPRRAREEASRDAERALSVDRDTTAFNRSRLLQRADNLRSRARMTRRGAALANAAEGVGAVASILRRG